MIGEVMAAEVTEFCGPKHAPLQSNHYRAGSSPGRVLYEGEREDVVRPRVRQKSDDGSSHEVDLASYQAAKNPQQLQSQIIQAIVAGVNIQDKETASVCATKFSQRWRWRVAVRRYSKGRRSHFLFMY